MIWSAWLTAADYFSENSIDYRNYDSPAELVEMRKLFAELLSLPIAQVVSAENSSLELMYLDSIPLNLTGTE